MSQSRETFPDDLLIRYLLGSLPEEEAERLDEESIVDDELAERLRLAEDDLVDAYATGTLTAERRDRFESYYLASRRRRKRVGFAKSFLAGIDRRESRLAPLPRSAAGRPAAPSRVPWIHAAAAVLLLGVSVLVAEQVSLRRDLNGARHQLTAATERATAMSAELENQRQAVASATQALADARAARPIAAIALVLRPQTRGVGPIPIVAVATGARLVPLDLEFEAAALGSYEAALKDPATNRTIWRGPPTASRHVQGIPVVSVDVPATLLKPQHYALDLFELRAGATLEFVGSYAFEVARR